MPTKIYSPSAACTKNNRNNMWLLSCLFKRTNGTTRPNANIAMFDIMFYKVPVHFSDHFLSAVMTVLMSTESLIQI